MSLDSEEGVLPVRRGFIFIFLISATLALIAGFGFRGRTAPPPPERRVSEATRVLVARAKTGTLDLEIEGIGKVLPWREVELAPEVSGRVASVATRLGQEVRTGDVLLAMDPQPYEDTLREREAALQRSQARIQETEASLRRAEELRERGALSDTEYEAALAQFRTAEADVAAASAGRDRAQRQLDDTRLRAPFAGTIVDRRVDPGALIGPDRTVFSLVDLDTVAVEAGLTEAEVVHIETGQHAVVTIATMPGVEAEGTVDGIAPRTDPATGTYRVRIRVDNRGDRGFLAGMVARIVFPYGRLEEVTLVPAVALVREETGDHVFVVRDNRAARVPVRVLGRRDDHVAIEATGIRPGDSIIVVGQGVVLDGDTVEVAEAR